MASIYVLVRQRIFLSDVSNLDVISNLRGKMNVEKSKNMILEKSIYQNDQIKI